MSSLPQVSLCVPDSLTSASPNAIQEFYDNVNQFFLKFPLHYEVLFATEKSLSTSQDLLAKIAAEDPRIRLIVLNTNSRAKALEGLFRESSADILVATDIALKIPLGDLFKMLQELYTEPSLQAVFGNRFMKSQKAQPAAPSVQTKLEIFYQGIIQEKTRWAFKDLFCPSFALRKSAFQELLPGLKSKGWHWTHEVQRAIQKKDFKAIEVPVFEHASLTNEMKSDNGPSRFEALNLLSFVLFRI